MFYSIERALPEDATRVAFAHESGRIFPAGELYFCDTCKKLLSRFDISEVTDCYYCPQCLQGLPSTIATAQEVRCQQCFVCPQCEGSLSFVIQNYNESENGEFQPKCEEYVRPIKIQQQQLQANKTTTSGSSPRSADGTSPKNSNVPRVFFCCYSCNWDSLHVSGAHGPVADKLLSDLVRLQKRSPAACLVREIAQHLLLKEGTSSGITANTLISYKTHRSIKSQWFPSRHSMSPASGADDAEDGGGEFPVRCEEGAFNVWCEFPMLLKHYHGDSGTGRGMALRFEDLLGDSDENQKAMDDEEAEVRGTRWEAEGDCTVPGISHYEKFPNITDSCISKLPPQRRQLLANRSHRCRECHSFVLSTGLKKSAAEIRLDRTAMTVLPRFNLLRVTQATDNANERMNQLNIDSRFPPLHAGVTGKIEFEMMNIQDVAIQIKFKFDEFPSNMRDQLTGKITTPDFETSIDHLHSLVSNDIHTKQMDDSWIITSRKYCQIRVRLAFAALSSAVAGSILKIGFTIEMQHRSGGLTFHPVFVLGKIV